MGNLKEIRERWESNSKGPGGVHTEIAFLDNAHADMGYLLKLVEAQGAAIEVLKEGMAFECVSGCYDHTKPCESCVAYDKANAILEGVVK